MLYDGRPGGQRHYAHKIIPYDVKPGDRRDGIDATLRPGRTVKGRVVGPDGQAVADATDHRARSTSTTSTSSGGATSASSTPATAASSCTASTPSGRPGWRSSTPTTSGAPTVELSGKQAGEEMTVRLQPCGRATARLVGTDGKPIAGLFPQFEILGSPGPRQDIRVDREQAELAADTVYVPNIDPRYHLNLPRTGADGRITLPDLIPGATYRISGSVFNVPTKRDPVYKDFTVKPGETLDLGDIPIDRAAGLTHPTCYWRVAKFERDFREHLG